MIFYTEIIVFHLIVMKMIHVSADLPEFVYRTKKCPIPNNITDWRRSSKRLGCKHDILSKDPREQESVYHCVPTNYLNETVEFCGKSVPSDGGYCPVYTYEFGKNESPNFANCSEFLEGCPKEFFFSKQVFQFPACNDINRKNKCYRSDPTCCTDPCVTRRKKPNAQENITYGHSKETTRNVAVFAIGTFFAISLIAVCLFVFLKNVKWKGYMVIRKENGEIPDLYRVKLDDFLFTTGLKLTPDNVRRLKFALQGNLKTKSSRRYKTLTKINDGVELLKFMDHLYDFSMNIYILQGFLERIDEDGLVEKCIEFVERKTNTYINKYYKKRETLEELPDLPDSLNYINIAIMGAPLQGDFTFVNMCTEALKSRTAIQTRAALMTTSSNSTTPLTVISSKTKSGRPIQIRILESENIQTMDSIVDSSTCANEASTGRRSLSELDRKIHCVVYALDACEETLYGYDEIDNEKIKNSVLNQEKPKVLLLWTKNFSEMTFQDVFRFRVQACDEFGLPLRLIMPACDPLSNETHTNEALKSLLDMINRAIEYASKSSQ